MYNRRTGKIRKDTDNHQWGYAGGSIELGETVEELKFFDVDDIPEDISEPIRPVFREYIKMRKRIK